MRYGELFAGVGGLSLGLDRAGFECAFHAQWDPDDRGQFAQRVLKHRWPDTPLYGDVRELDGAKLISECGPIDLLSGGSPCQDLSVAGKRKGMTEGSGTRSALFFEQVRLYNETNAEYLLWENVDGARSSNNGKDFACVLSALVGGAIVVPGDGWRSAGVAAGPAGIAAWRVLDAQFFGVPQRRRRVFVLCSRTGRVDPAEVLLEREGVRRDSATRRSQRQVAAARPGTSAEGEGSVATPWDSVRMRVHDARDVAPTLSGMEGRGAASPTVLALDALNQTLDPVAGSLRSECGGGGLGMVLAFDMLNQDDTGAVAHTIRDGHGEGMPAVLAFDTTQITCPNNYSSPKLGDPCHPLAAGAHAPAVAFGMVTKGNGEAFLTHERHMSLSGGGGQAGQGYPAVLAFHHKQDPDAHPYCPPLGITADGMGVCVTGETTHSLTHEGHDASEDGTGRGTPIVVGSLQATDGGVDIDKAAAGHVVADTFRVDAPMAVTTGIPRRLLPIECERLMGWPDNWTNVPDENGKPASDSARYRACGNGVVSEQPEWIGRRLIRVLEQ